MSIFAERLRGLLDSRGINQVWLAEKIGATGATVSRYMTMDRTPRGDNIAAVAKALDVSADYLLGLSDDMTSMKQQRQNILNPEARLLVSAYQKATDSDQRVIWTLLEKYLSPEERGFLDKLMEYASKSVG